MIPSGGNLTPMNGRSFELDPTLIGNPNQDGLINRSVRVRAVRHTDRLTVRPAKGHGSGDYGCWIPYCTGRAVIGYLGGGQTWFGSGPFSGCSLVVGRNTATGQVFCAHIARDGARDGNQDTAVEVWDAHLGGNIEIWYQNQIPIPSSTFYSGSHVFITIGGGAILSMARVDVNTGAVMGGANGAIFNVHVFK